VHCTKISPEFECQGQRSRSPGQKNEEVQHFVRELSSGVRSSASSTRWENQHMLSGLLVIFVHCHICVTVR